MTTLRTSKTCIANQRSLPKLKAALFMAMGAAAVLGLAGRHAAHKNGRTDLGRARRAARFDRRSPPGRTIAAVASSRRAAAARPGRTTAAVASSRRAAAPVCGDAGDAAAPQVRAARDHVRFYDSYRVRFDVGARAGARHAGPAAPSVAAQPRADGGRRRLLSAR